MTPAAASDAAAATSADCADAAASVHCCPTVWITIPSTVPGVPIAFNTTPLDSADAAARWLGGAG